MRALIFLGFLYLAKELKCLLCCTMTNYCTMTENSDTHVHSFFCAYQKTLPLLRAQSRPQLSHVQQSITPAKILPPQQVQQKNATTTLAASPQMHKHNSQVQKIQIVQQPGQPQIMKQVILTPAQQQLFRRQQQINAQRVFLTTSTGTTPGSQVVTSTRNVVMLQASPGSTSKMVAASSRSQAGTTSTAAAADKLKPKGFTGISR